MIRYYRSYFIIDSNSRISYLEYELEKQKNINKELEKSWLERNNELIKLYKRIDLLEFHKLREKIITALHDLILNDNLENNFIHPYSLCFNKLKKYNNNVNRYFDFNDNINIINNKKKILLLKLLDLSQDNIIEINLRFSYHHIYFSLIEEIIKYLDNNKDNDTLISDDELEEIKNWWTI